MPSSLLMPVGQDVDLFPIPSELTVAQAARILDISGTCIDELIGLGVLKYRQEGTRYWIDRDRLFEYKHDWERGYAWLSELTRESQEMGLYDMEFKLEEYNATRKAIRNADRSS